MLSASIWDTVIWEMATSASKSPTARATVADVGAERAQGIGAVVVVVRHRSYGPVALTQQRHNLAAHAADSPAGTGHQDETRLSHRSHRWSGCRTPRASRIRPPSRHERGPRSSLCSYR